MSVRRTAGCIHWSLQRCSVIFIAFPPATGGGALRVLHEAMHPNMIAMNSSAQRNDAEKKARVRGARCPPPLENFMEGWQRSDFGCENAMPLGPSCKL